MNVVVRKYTEKDLPEMIRIWNAVVEDGVAFPQTEDLDAETGKKFFGGMTYNGVAEDQTTGKILGLYILHPNNVGRCGHLANASYAVDECSRGLHIGERLVSDCMDQAAAHGPRHGIQRGRKNQHPCAPSLRTSGIYAARHGSGRLPHEGRALRRYLSLL